MGGLRFKDRKHVWLNGETCFCFWLDKRVLRIFQAADGRFNRGYQKLQNRVSRLVMNDVADFVCRIHQHHFGLMAGDFGLR